MKVKKENLVKGSKQFLCSQEKVLVLIWDSESFFFVFTDDGFSLILGFTKFLCSPENPLLRCDLWNLLTLCIALKPKTIKTNVNLWGCIVSAVFRLQSDGYQFKLIQLDTTCIQVKAPGIKLMSQFWMADNHVPRL